MPVTAIWFLFLGFLTLVGTAMGAALTRSFERRRELLEVGGNIGIGLCVGPTVYLSLAVLA